VIGKSVLGPTHPPIQSSPWGKGTRAWSWPLASI